MADPAYRRGLQDVGAGAYAYLQPDGTWGWSNAGLIVDGDASLLVDTLFDLRLTREMLDAMRRSVPAAERIGTLVNTHGNGDHCFGNALVEGARKVASRRAVEDMRAAPPELLAALKRQAPELGTLGEYVQHCFGPFAFEGVELDAPEETFDGELALRVGDREVRLLEVGPAHTRGDTLVHVPDARLLYAGDILFWGVHPIAWAGPVSNWIAALDRIAGLDVDVVVPGHGPIAGLAAVRELRDYFEYVDAEARRRLQDGMDPAAAARDIALDRWASWGDAERIVVTVAAVHRELTGDTGEPNVLELWTRMAEHWRG